MYCRNCANQIADEAAICVKCGVPTDKGNKFCRHCGKETLPSQEICTGCGLRLSSSAHGDGREFLPTILLAILPMCIGLGGIHRLYTGHIAIGIIQLLSGGGCFIWQLIDIIMIATGSFKDREGRPLKQ